MRNATKVLAIGLVILAVAAWRLQALTLTAVKETPTLDGSDNGDWTGNPIVTANNVLLKAAYDDSNFYLLAQWADPSLTESVKKNQWRYDGVSWSQSGDEDRIAVMWDLGTTPEGAKCAFMCHPPLMYTTDGTVDVWHWKATRSNPMGYADDRYFIAIQDTTPGGETRLGDGGNATYNNNGGGGPHPAFQANTDPNSNVDFLVADGPTLQAFDPFGVMTSHSVKTAVAFVDSGWMTLATVSGYVLQVPVGSRADVRTAGRFTPGSSIWTIEFTRSLTTSGPNDDIQDVQFDPANVYNFSVAIWDHAGGMDHQVDTESHRLVFETTGIGDGPGGPTIPTSVALSQNYPNPFNPSTSIRYAVHRTDEENPSVELQVFSLHGRLVRTLVRTTQAPGNYTVHWDGTDNSGYTVPSGLYIYRLTVGEASISRKMALLK